MSEISKNFQMNWSSREILPEDDVKRQKHV